MIGAPVNRWRVFWGWFLIINAVGQLASWFGMPDHGWGDILLAAVLAGGIAVAIPSRWAR